MTWRQPFTAGDLRNVASLALFKWRLRKELDANDRLPSEQRANPYDVAARVVLAPLIADIDESNR